MMKRTFLSLIVVGALLSLLSEAHGALVTTTRTNGTNLFVDGGSTTSSVTFASGVVSSQVLEVRAQVRYMKADGQAYGVNNGGTPYYDEIDLRLTSPGGLTTSLIGPNDFNTGAGTGGFGFGNARFRAGSGYVIANTDPNLPRSGNQRAMGDLRNMENQAAEGTWTVYIGDTVLNDGLSVDRVRITLWTGDPTSTVAGSTAFGNVLVGQSSDLTTSVSNTGDTRAITNDGTIVSTQLAGTIADPTGSSSFSAVAGSSTFSGVTVGGSTADRTFRFSPTARSAGESGSVQITTDGGNQTSALSGRGVAPQAAIDTSATNAGQVRIGDTGTSSITIDNVGDGNLSGLGAVSNLNGSSTAASGNFSGSGASFSLNDGGSVTVDYTFSPTGHTNDTTSVSVNLTNGSPDGTNSALNQSVTLQGQGVGPSFNSAGDTAGTLDFGDVGVGQTVSMPLTLSNNTADGDLGALTDMSLFSVTLSGTNPGDFSVLGFTPTVLSEGEALGLIVSITPTLLGLLDATLTFLTDVDSPFGVAGTAYTFTLQGNGIVAVPEPTSELMLLLGVVGLVVGLWIGRRKSRPLKDAGPLPVSG